MSEKIQIEVAYALPDRQTLLSLKIDKEFTVLDAIRSSGIVDMHPEIDLDSVKVGVFSKLAKLTDTLHNGDRIEIYRPLIADPKEVRKQRALKAKEQKN